ncbi:MAG: tetratricopeptide repeat protein [Planctomycetes bacterium]|nr:tetratricopeptide repeat protein [Planctomycetota bacterium]
MSTRDLYEKARQAVERSNYEYAIELLREVLRQDPGYQDARLILRGAERRMLRENHSAVLSAIGVPFAVLKTLIARRFKKGKDRLEVYEDFLEKHPNSFWGLMSVSAAARAAGLLNESVEMYKDAVKQRPESTRALRALADALKEAGEVEEALKYLSRLSALQPENRDVLAEMRDLEATEHMAVHRMEDVDSFRDVIRDKEAAKRLEEGRRQVVSMDDLRKEAERMEQELVEHPKSSSRIVRLARLYQDTGQMKKAGEFLKEKHRQQPDNYEIREALGDLQLAIYDRALQTVENALEEAPENSELKAKREKIRRARARFGVKEYQWRLSEHPTDSAHQLQLGRFYLEDGQYDEAIGLLQDAVRDSHSVMEARHYLGLCFMGKNQYDLALEQFKQALAGHSKMDEAGKELRYHQAQAHEAMGNREEALRFYKQIYSQDIHFRDVAAKVEALG